MMRQTITITREIDDIESVDLTVEFVGGLVTESLDEDGNTVKLSGTELAAAIRLMEAGHDEGGR
jgi:hypothetical protein